MYQNDMKKGQTGRMKNGWDFRIEDNKKGNVRMATVYGDYTEIGSIYTSDIAWLDMPDGSTEGMQQTATQAKKSQRSQTLMHELFGEV